jgi:hypothetical protein
MGERLFPHKEGELNVKLSRLLFFSLSLGNQFLEDSALRSYLEIMLPKEVLDSMNPELICWGERCIGGIHNN